MNTYPNTSMGKKRFKTSLAKTVFWFLGRGFQSVATFDKSVKKEIEIYDEGTIIMLKVNSFGPHMVMQKKGDKLIYLGNKKVKDADLTISFKNIEVAVLVLTGQLGVAQAYAEHRYVVKGDLYLIMPLVRALCVVEAYLFPKFMAKKILKEMPKRTNNKFNIYAATVFGIK